MVTLTNADKALKSLYLGVVANALNTGINPLLAKIKQTTKDVWGKEIRVLAPYGINGGFGAGTETGALPTAAGNNYVQFVSTLKNLYGTISLSDKAIRASENNAGAFVNLLNDEMEGLIKASAFNFGRMLYGDGTGKLATVSSVSTNSITVDSVKYLIEGMIVDSYDSTTLVKAGMVITAIDRSTNTITVDNAGNTVATNKLYVQGSKDNEITGLQAIFDNTTLYGVTKSTNSWINPYGVTATDGLITDAVIQAAIDNLDEVAGSEIDFIVCSSDAKRAYQEYLNTYRRNIDVVNLNGGFKAISFNGIPLVSDKFAPNGTMYLLNSKDFAIHQLCDWKWLEGDDGKIIKQNAGYATYTATLVKYADLMCNKPSGQGKISGITCGVLATE